MPKGAEKVIRRVGSVRPSQLLYSYGVGSLVDLPSFSVIVHGLDGWDESRQHVLTEDRLLAAVQAEPGMSKVKELREPPWLPETRNVFDDWAYVGVPVSPFPRWLRCSACSFLASIDTGLFKLETFPYRPDRARYAHSSCTKARGRPPTALPARFVTGCARGHLDEFPWMSFVHAGQSCGPDATLEAVDIAEGARSTDVLIRCRACRVQRTMAQAFGEGAEKVLPRCRGHHPHLRRFDDGGCPHQARALLVGASNQWFPVTRTVLSIPTTADTIEQLVAEHWALIDPAPTKEALAYGISMNPQLAPLRGLDLDLVWRAVEARRSQADSDIVEEQRDLIGPEWHVLCEPATAPTGPDFHLAAAGPPSGWDSLFGPTILAERLREVTALLGFTRLEGRDAASSAVAPISTGPPTWLPASQTRGEGIFIRLDEAAVEAWEQQVAGTTRTEAIRRAAGRWCGRRNIQLGAWWPGERFLLLHSLSHAIINEVALECGYAAASIRERIYARGPGLGGPPMAGILLYTSAPDAEGTLGGLVSLGAPASLGQILDHVAGRLACASDPTCAEHLPGDDEEVLHGAACHACLFVPETSCERGNTLLDRALVAPSLAADVTPFLVRDR